MTDLTRDEALSALRQNPYRLTGSILEVRHAGRWLRCDGRTDELDDIQICKSYRSIRSVQRDCKFGARITSDGSFLPITQGSDG